MCRGTTDPPPLPPKKNKIKKIIIKKIQNNSNTKKYTYQIVIVDILRIVYPLTDERSHVTVLAADRLHEVSDTYEINSTPLEGTVKTTWGWGGG